MCASLRLIAEASVHRAHCFALKEGQLPAPLHFKPATSASSFSKQQLTLPCITTGYRCSDVDYRPQCTDMAALAEQHAVSYGQNLTGAHFVPMSNSMYELA